MMKEQNSKQAFMVNLSTAFLAVSLTILAAAWVWTGIAAQHEITVNTPTHDTTITGSK